MKIISWNINGIKSWKEKGDCFKFLEKHNPDIFCVQEIKTSQDWASAGMEPELISLGVGLRLFDGKVTIDASIEESTFIDGTYILSGIEGPLFGKVSIGINY